MLMDIDRCKALDLTSRCLQIISTTTLDYPDQDALNMALEGEVVYLPQKWNLVDGYLQTRYYKRLPSKIKKLVRGNDRQTQCYHPLYGIIQTVAHRHIHVPSALRRLEKILP